MTALIKLRAAASISELASLLGYSSSALTYIVFKLPIADKYISFDIPKKDGTLRRINAPCPHLKVLQRRLSEYLMRCMSELEEGKPPTVAHGFKKNQSILTNAAQHYSKRFVFNADIQDFFGTINFGRVRGYFLKSHDFQLHEKVATTIAQIACHENQLPQGSPCTPSSATCLLGHWTVESSD